MLQTKRGFRRKYVYGGKGLLDTLTGLLGRAFTSSAAKTLGQKAVSAATSAAVKGVEKGAAKAVDHVVEKMSSKRQPKSRPLRDFVNRPSPSSKEMSSQQRSRLNNLISGSGIATIRDVVKRYR